MRLKGDLWWTCWIAGGIATFALLETLALAEYPDYRHTLTAYTRRWLGIYPARRHRAASSVVLAGTLAGTITHFLIDPPHYARYADRLPRFTGAPDTTENLPLSFRLDPDT